MSNPNGLTDEQTREKPNKTNIYDLEEVRKIKERQRKRKLLEKIIKRADHIPNPYDVGDR